MEDKLSFFKFNFWDLWLQKIFRNIASSKYQFMWAIFIIVIYGMFNIDPSTKEPFISSMEGLSFLGGGFVTFSTTRLLINTKLVEKENKDFDTDS